MAFRKPRLPDDLTPEQREARIAELRARRHARMRTLAIRSAIGSMALALLAAVFLYWMLATFGGRDFLLDLNTDSVKTITAQLEPALGTAEPGARYQFERHGYFVADTADSRPNAPVFNRAVTLRDSWIK